MKLYYTVTDGIKDNETYLNMLKLSLETAYKNTSLKLYALYDGTKDDEIYKLFKKYKVNVIICKCSFEDKLKKYKPYSYVQNSNFQQNYMLGCFMKFDIALFEKEDEVVLYSDIDTMFLKDIDESDFKNIKTIGVAPENKQDFDIVNGKKYFNAGIMAINVKEVIKRRELLFDMLEKNQEPYHECYDQGFFNELYQNDFEKIPLKYNWKTYWGINNDAVIIHIHGYKLGAEKFNNEALKNLAILQNSYEGAYEGIIYYFLMAYEILKIDKKRYIAQMANILTLSKIKNEKLWMFSTYFLHFIYEKLQNKKLNFITKKLYKYSENKLKKRNIISSFELKNN